MSWYSTRLIYVQRAYKFGASQPEASFILFLTKSHNPHAVIVQLKSGVLGISA